MDSLIMYSLYDCDEWRTAHNMILEYETLDREMMNLKIKEIIRDNYPEEPANKGFDLENDDLVKLVNNQQIDYLDLTLREINVNDKTIEIFNRLPY